MGNDLAILRELEFAANQSIRQLSWLDGERGDVPRQLGRILFETFTEHDLEDARPRLVRSAVNQSEEVWFDFDGHGRRGSQ
jgi:hypothetical protein